MRHFITASLTEGFTEDLNASSCEMRYHRCEAVSELLVRFIFRKVGAMKRLVAISAISILLFSIFVSPSAQTPRITMGHSEWVARSLDAIQTIKVGTTRRELLKLFTVEGGQSSRASRTYVFRECPYIKIDVGFEPVGAPQDKLKEHMEDKIIRISKPYLEKSVID